MCESWGLTQVRNLGERGFVGVLTVPRVKGSVYDESREENIVLRSLASLFNRTFEIFTIGPYAPFRECSDNQRRDAVLKHNPSHTAILLEIDENCHKCYDTTCEYATVLNHCPSILAQYREDDRPAG